MKKEFDWEHRKPSTIKELIESIPAMVEDKEPEIIVYNIDGKDVTSPRTESVEDALKQRSITYTIRNMKDELKTKGLGTDWIDAYKKEVNKK